MRDRTREPIEGDRPRITGHQAIKPAKIGLSREFRQRPTPAEALAWRLLRNRGILGLKFRRQQVVDGFIVDFYCPEKRVALEIDGRVHDQPIAQEYDRARTDHLTRRGVQVLRIRNEDVSRETLERLLMDLS